MYYKQDRSKVLYRTLSFKITEESYVKLLEIMSRKHVKKSVAARDVFEAGLARKKK